MYVELLYKNSYKCNEWVRRKNKALYEKIRKKRILNDNDGGEERLKTRRRERCIDYKIKCNRQAFIHQWLWLWQMKRYCALSKIFPHIDVSHHHRPHREVSINKCTSRKREKSLMTWWSFFLPTIILQPSMNFPYSQLFSCFVTAFFISFLL